MFKDLLVILCIAIKETVAVIEKEQVKNASVELETQSEQSFTAQRNKGE